MTNEERRNCEGLIYLTWDMFDSPDQPGSGYKFMEREPVLALDNAMHKLKRKPFTEIVMAYASPNYAKNKNLSMNDSHRIGKAIQLRCPNGKKKRNLIKELLAQDIPRIALQRNGNHEIVYFDTDDQKEVGIFNWIFKE